MTVAERISYAFGNTSITAFVVAKSDEKVVAILIRERPADESFIATLKKRFPHATLQHDKKGLSATVRAIQAFVERPQRNLDLPLEIRATEFQARVYAAVMKVPFGKTTTFSAIASKIGSPAAVRAVGNACTQNPLEFAIPCHRVLRSDGSYSGGGEWGDHRQAAIVEREEASRLKK